MGSPTLWPKTSQSATSMADRPRASAPMARKAIPWPNAYACRATSRGSLPSRYGAAVWWIYAAAASAPWKVSPSPTRPSSVCTCTHTTFGYVGVCSVSTRVIFTLRSSRILRGSMSAPREPDPARSVRDHSTGHVDRLTGHVAGLARGEKSDDLRDVLGLLCATERNGGDA